MSAWEDRRIIRTPLPPTEDEAIRFENFRARWERLLDEGEARDWIDWLPDGGYGLGKPRPGGYAEHEETDEEYEKRMANDLAKNVWELQQSLMSSLLRELGIVRHIETLRNEPDEDGRVTFPVKKREDDD